jgi:hypothetical protein
MIETRPASARFRWPAPTPGIGSEQAVGEAGRGVLRDAVVVLMFENRTLVAMKPGTRKFT